MDLNQKKKRLGIRELELHLYTHDIIFAFSGHVSYSIVSTVGTAVREELGQDGSNKELYNVYYVFVELLTNIMNYSTKRKDDESASGTCFVTQDKNTQKYTVCSGNMINSSHEDMLREKLDKINSLDDVELKAYHKEVRRAGKDKHNKGAGLGFIEIARKVGKKLKYEITKIDDNSSYFEIHVDI
ncbi:MAG: SiaB family protein kinase [Campylobacterota bacterium]|nr:SiaB family protein kinase [Campylobacterota bacterium]